MAIDPESVADHESAIDDLLDVLFEGVCDGDLAPLVFIVGGDRHAPELDLYVKELGDLHPISALDVLTPDPGWFAVGVVVPGCARSLDPPFRESRTVVAHAMTATTAFSRVLLPDGSVSSTQASEGAVVDALARLIR